MLRPPHVDGQVTPESASCRGSNLTLSYFPRSGSGKGNRSQSAKPPASVAGTLYPKKAPGGSSRRFVRAPRFIFPATHHPRPTPSWKRFCDRALRPPAACPAAREERADGRLSPDAALLPARACASARVPHPRKPHQSLFVSRQTLSPQVAPKMAQGRTSWFEIEYNAYRIPMVPPPGLTFLG